MRIQKDSLPQRAGPLPSSHKTINISTLQVFESSVEVHLLFISGALFFSRHCAKVRSVNAPSGNKPGSKMKENEGTMSATKHAREETKPATGGSSQKRKNAPGYSSTTEIRAFLRDWKTRPQKQRELLCRMLRRAALYASTKDSAVSPAVTHHTTAP